MNSTKHFKLAALVAATLLASCGGGSGSGNPNNASAPPTGSQTGIFTDAAVQGLSYTTSSGVTGTTTAAGEFDFNPGDTVTFRLGALVLGELPAKELLTPIDLAGNSQAYLENLLVILQSLDDDGNPDNGITIPPAAAAAMPSLNLASVTSQTLTTSLEQARTAGNVGGSIRTPEEARAHFIAQAPALLATNIWVLSENGVPMIALNAQANGKYLFGEYGVADSVGQPGVEYGRFTATSVNTRGFLFGTSYVGSGEIDNNGEWGLSHLGDDERIKVSGDILTVTPPNETEPMATFVKMENNPNGIVGAWAFAGEDGKALDNRMFLFFANNKVMMVDGVGDDEVALGEVPCGGPGIEIGDYTYNAGTKTLTFANNPLVNTNQCAGIWETDGTSGALAFVLSNDGKTAALESLDGQPPVSFVRISK